jgi:hypothetical protein
MFSLAGLEDGKDRSLGKGESSSDFYTHFGGGVQPHTKTRDMGPRGDESFTSVPGKGEELDIREIDRRRQLCVHDSDTGSGKQSEHVCTASFILCFRRFLFSLMLCG